MKVTFSSTHSAFSIKAPAGTLVSLTGTPTEAVDGVYTIGDEGCINIDEQMLTKDIYLSITGEDYTVAAGARIAYPAEGVEVRAGSSVLPFKIGGKGGGGGSGGGCTYRGTTTTAISNGSTTNPITIDGESYTAVFGDVVVYNYTEFVFDGTQWSEFGKPFDTTPTSGSANAVTSDGVYRNTAGKKYYVDNDYKGEIFNNYNNIASGTYSHAEGNYTEASGPASHAEGFHTTASGGSSHAEGYHTTASEPASHAEGYHTTASGGSSHASGYYTIASGHSSHAGGYSTIANKTASTAIGKYNVADTDKAHLLIVGNGTNEQNRSNIFEVSETDVNVNGDIKKNGAGIDDYTTTERKIGKWIDGSDLYQRTFEVTASSVNGWNDDTLGTSGIKIVDVQGFMYGLYEDTYIFKPLAYFRSIADYIACIYDDDVNIYVMDPGVSTSPMPTFTITIKYTKPSEQVNALNANLIPSDNPFNVSVMESSETPTSNEEPTDEMR